MNDQRGLALQGNRYGRAFPHLREVREAVAHRCRTDEPPPGRELLRRQTPGQQRHTGAPRGKVDQHYRVKSRSQRRRRSAGWGRMFSVTTETIFLDHKMPLKSLLKAIALFDPAPLSAVPR